jgi:hypothetical protein
MKEKLKSYAAKLVAVLKALFVGLFSKAKSLFLNSSLKAKIYAGVAILFIVLFGVILCQAKSIKTLRYERNVYKNNETVLMQKSKQYVTKDGLSAATANELQMKLSEFKKYRAEDAKIISSLKIKNRKLESIVSVKSTTTIPIHTTLKDSTVDRKAGIKDSIIHDTLKCIDIRDKWYILKGTISGHKLDGEAVINNSLDIAATIKYKRFLGFLWYTNHIKDKRVDVVSKNPYEKIDGVEFDVITK